MSDLLWWRCPLSGTVPFSNPGRTGGRTWFLRTTLMMTLSAWPPSCLKCRCRYPVSCRLRKNGLLKNGLLKNGLRTSGLRTSGQMTLTKRPRMRSQMNFCRKSRKNGRTLRSLHGCGGCCPVNCHGCRPQRRCFPMSNFRAKRWRNLCLKTNFLKRRKNFWMKTKKIGRMKKKL